MLLALNAFNPVSFSVAMNKLFQCWNSLPNGAMNLNTHLLLGEQKSVYRVQFGAPYLHSKKSWHTGDYYNWIKISPLTTLDTEIDWKHWILKFEAFRDEWCKFNFTCFTCLLIVMTWVLEISIKFSSQLQNICPLC